MRKALSDFLVNPHVQTALANFRVVAPAMTTLLPLFESGGTTADERLNALKISSSFVGYSTFLEVVARVLHNLENGASSKPAIVALSLAAIDAILPGILFMNPGEAQKIAGPIVITVVAIAALIVSRLTDNPTPIAELIEEAAAPQDEQAPGLLATPEGTAISAAAVPYAAMIALRNMVAFDPKNPNVPGYTIDAVVAFSVLLNMLPATSFAFSRNEITAGMADQLKIMFFFGVVSLACLATDFGHLGADQSNIATTNAAYAFALLSLYESVMLRLNPNPHNGEELTRVAAATRGTHMFAAQIIKPAGMIWTMAAFAASTSDSESAMYRHAMQFAELMVAGNFAARFIEIGFAGYKTDRRVDWKTLGAVAAIAFTTAVFGLLSATNTLADVKGHDVRWIFGIIAGLLSIPLFGAQQELMKQPRADEAAPLNGAAPAVYGLPMMVWQQAGQFPNPYAPLQQQGYTR